MKECIIPAAGSRMSVRIHTPARKSRRRRCTFFFVVRRFEEWRAARKSKAAEAAIAR